MKYNVKKYPILKMLEDEKLGTIGFFESDIGIPNSPEYMLFLKNNFYKFSPYFKKHIYSQTDSFSDAILKSCESLVRDDVWDSIGMQYGTILNMKNPFIKDLSVMYFIKETNNIGCHDYVVYFFSKNIFTGLMIQSVSKDLFNHVMSNEFKSSIPYLQNLGVKSDNYLQEICNFLYSLLIANINFMKYANVETRILQPKERITDISCKYTNDSDSRITILDSTWFTNLVKSESFNVRGHFRLQPCGQAFKDKKLIWIDSFQKSGYNRKATVELIKPDVAG